MSPAVITRPATFNAEVATVSLAEIVGATNVSLSPFPPVPVSPRPVPLPQRPPVPLRPFSPSPSLPISLSLYSSHPLLPMKSAMC